MVLLVSVGFQQFAFYVVSFDSFSSSLRGFGGEGLVRRKVASNTGDFDDPLGIYGSTQDVTFGSPISMNQIVFAAFREPVARQSCC